MNCERFQAHLYEYVEGSLKPQEQQAAAGHLAECTACRERLAQEQLLAQTLAQGFRQGTKDVALPPDFSERLLTALQDEPESKVVALNLPANSGWARFAWPVAIAAGVLGTSFRLSYFFPEANPAALPRPKIAAVITPTDISLHYVYCAPKYTFHREGNQVVDALECEPRTVEISFHRNDRQKPL